jgi:subtilisin family serine protease
MILLWAATLVVVDPFVTAGQAEQSRYIVRFKERTTAAATAAVYGGQMRSSEAAFGMQVVSVLRNDGAVVAALSHNQALELAARTDVESVELDQPMRAFRTTNDPLLHQQYGLEATTGVNAFSAWDTSTGSRLALVAVMDSGVDDTHPDLTGAIWRNPKEIARNGRDDDGNGYVDDFRGYDFVNGDALPRDDQGHGSHVSGIIAATGNNSKGVAGVAWGSKIIPLKVLNSSGDGFTSDIVEAMDYVGDLRRRGAPIVAINMSFGGSSSSTLERAVKRALQNDLLIVAAAGNESSDNDLLKVYPASYDLPHVLSVSAVDQDGNLSSFSNYGAQTVSLSAPGDDVVSTVPFRLSGSYYDTLSGTSMAAPYVAGAAALVAATNRKLTAPLIRRVLMESVRESAALSGLSVSEGYLDAGAAVALAPLQSTNFRVSGRVTDSRGRGVRGVMITLQARGKPTRRVSTGIGGSFAIDRVAAAPYTVRAAKRGVRTVPSQRVLNLFEDREMTFRIRN